MLFRHCIISTTDGKAIQRPDGSWTVEGLGAERYQSAFETRERVYRPLNSSFYMTTNTQECLDRIKSNLSDGSNHLLPIQIISSDYHTPEPLFPGKIQFITGYVQRENYKPEHENITVLSNLQMVSPTVYGCFALLSLIILFIISLHLRILYRYQEKKRWWFKRLDFTHLVGREVSLLFHLSSHHFRWVTHLYAISLFYLIICFTTTYKTSQVVTKKPDYPTSYQESLDHPTSLIFIYNQIVHVSNTFRDAPHHSLKGKLYTKLVASGKEDAIRIEGLTKNPTAAFSLFKMIAAEIIHHKSIAAASSITIPLLKGFACGFSPEGILWFLKVFADPSETEIIYGFTLSKHYRFSSLAVRAQRRAFESHIFAHHYALSFDVASIAANIAGTSRTHQWKQHLACSQSSTSQLQAEDDVQTISLSYFHFIITLCISGIVNALFILLIEIAWYERSKRKPRRRRLNYLIIKSMNSKSFSDAV